MTHGLVLYLVSRETNKNRRKACVNFWYLNSNHQSTIH